MYSAEEVNLMHLNADKDAGAGALHHTLGQGSSQASPGNHDHDGRNSKRLKPDYLQFDTTYTGGSIAPGMLAWNDTDGTLEFRLKGNNVTLQIGQEQVMRVKAADNGGLINGKVVRFIGSDGANKTVAYAQANAEVNSTTTIAVMTEDAVGGAAGFATTFGLVRDINTSALTEGAVVWLSPTVLGGMTTTKPSAPQHSVIVGYCVRSHAVNGSIFVNVQNGYELEELHNVKITSPTDGQYLRYQASTGLWVNSA